jgi:hypothetical protein
MVGPDDVIKLEVGRVQTFFKPLWGGAVNKTLGTIAHRTGFPAGITTNTAARLLLEESPPIFWRHLFESPRLGISLCEREFLHRISQPYICLDRVSMNACLTGGVEIALTLQ